MLNGRVYGSKRTTPISPFQNIRDGEPTFVEWGHGGAGSVNNHSGGVEGSKYASIQSGNKVSIGAISGADHKEMDREDYDDGSGTAWLRKRKQQRERERLEREAKDAERALSSKTTTVSNDVEVSFIYHYFCHPGLSNLFLETSSFVINVSFFIVRETDHGPSSFCDRTRRLRIPALRATISPWRRSLITVEGKVVIFLANVPLLK